MKTTQIYKAKISAQGQITIPSEVRAKLGVEKGSYIRFYIDKNSNIAITTKLTVEKYFGKVDVLGEKDPEVVAREYRESFGGAAR